MSKDKITKRHRIRTVAAGAGIAGVAATVGLCLFLGNQASAGTPQSSGIPAYAPADSDTMVLAPYTPDWWSKVTAMAPRELMLRGLTPDAGLKIEHIGYSRSQDTAERPIPGALRIFYIEASDDAEAQRIQDWLSTASGFEHRIVHRDGKVLAITVPWVTDYATPSQNMASVAGYRAELTDKQASMYFNPKLEVASLTGPAGGEKAKLLTTYMEKGLGFSADTAWTGTSKDGNSWSGSFVSGGVDPARLNFPEASSALAAQQKIVASYTEKDSGEQKTTRSGYDILDPGMSVLLGSSTVSAPSQKIQLGSNPLPPDVPKVDGAEVTALQNLNVLDGAATGVQGVSEQTLSRSISASRDKMVMSFTYSSDNPPAEK
jgi:hypothetical protein